MSSGKRNQLCLQMAILLIGMAVFRQNTLAGKLDNPSMLRGGLIYTEENPHTPIYVNQEFYHVIRNADISQLKKAAEKNARLLLMYGQRCGEVRRLAGVPDAVAAEAAPQPVSTATPNPSQTAKPNPAASGITEYTITPYEYQVRESLVVCTRQGAMLPEIRTGGQKEAVRSLANANNIRYVAAGMYYQEQGQRFRYNSDHTQVETPDGPPFSRYEYGGDYKGHGHTESGINGYYMKYYGAKYPIVYAGPDAEFAIRVADEDNLDHWQRIICQKRPYDPKQEEVTQAFQNQTNMFTLLAHHSCHRDADGLLEGITDTFEEIGAMTNSQVGDLAEIRRNFSQALAGALVLNDTYSPATRNKRNANSTRIRKTRQIAEMGAIAAGGMVGNMIYSAINNEAPLSWFGKVAGSIFGLTTHDDIKKYAETLRSLNKQMETLAFNDNELDEAIQEIDRKLSSFINFTIETMNGMAILNLVQDLREMIRHNIVLQETAMLKIANVLLASLQGRVSPYALSQMEMNKLAAQVKANQGLELDTEMSNSHMAAAIIDGQIQVFFRIPILNEDLLFSFYSVRGLPVFTDNGTFVPEMDTQFFALSKANEEYIDLLPQEYEQCIRAPTDCRVTSSTNPISGQAHCTIQTYLEHRLRCPLVQLQNPGRATFLTYGNTTYFSVPESTLLYVQCRDPGATFKAKHNSTRINGQGEITFRPGCTITTKTNSKWRTPATRAGITLPETGRLVVGVKEATKPTNVTFRFLAQKSPPANRTIIIKNITATRETSLDLTDPQDNMSFAMRYGAFTAAIALAAALAWYTIRTCRNKPGLCRAAWCPFSDSDTNGSEPPTTEETYSYKDLSEAGLTAVPNWNTHPHDTIESAEYNPTIPQAHEHEQNWDRTVLRSASQRQSKPTTPRPILKRNRSHVSFGSPKDAI